MNLAKPLKFSLNLTIENRPAPTFELVVTGDGLSTDRSCLIAIQPTNSNEDFTLTQGMGRLDTSAMTDGSVYDCSALPAGVHLVVLKVTNLENIASTQAVNIVRLPAEITQKSKKLCRANRLETKHQPRKLAGIRLPFSVSSLQSSCSLCCSNTRRRRAADLA